VFSDQRDVEPAPTFGRTESQIAWAQRFIVTGRSIYRARTRWRQCRAGVDDEGDRFRALNERENHEPFSHDGTTEHWELRNHASSQAQRAPRDVRSPSAGAPCRDERARAGPDGGLPRRRAHRLTERRTTHQCTSRHAGTSRCARAITSLHRSRSHRRSRSRSRCPCPCPYRQPFRCPCPRCPRHACAWHRRPRAEHSARAVVGASS
jgi:hypothetical protein